MYVPLMAKVHDNIHKLFNSYRFFPEQFTVKAHPALFEGEEGEPKNEALLFQSTVEIHFQNAHKTFQSTVYIHFQTRTNTKTAKASTLCVYSNC